MKPKKLDRKLYLNKKTVADLSTVELKGVHGGIVRVSFVCGVSDNNCTMFTQMEYGCYIGTNQYGCTNQINCTQGMECGMGIWPEV